MEINDVHRVRIVNVRPKLGHNSSWESGNIAAGCRNADGKSHLRQRSFGRLACQASLTPMGQWSA